MTGVSPRGSLTPPTPAKSPPKAHNLPPSMYAFKERGRSRGRALYRDASRAAYMLGPPPSRGGDLDLEGGVMCPCENMV